MTPLAAFVHFNGHLVGVLPYQEVMLSTIEEGVKEDIFPEGWQDDTEWVVAEVLNDATKEKYKVTLFIIRDYDENPYDLDLFANMFQHIAKDVITRFVVHSEVGFYYPNPQ